MTLDSLGFVVLLVFKGVAPKLLGHVDDADLEQASVSFPHNDCDES